MDEIAKKFHIYSVIWTRYPVQSFKTIASKKNAHVRNSYICLNVENVEKLLRRVEPTKQYTKSENKYAPETKHIIIKGAKYPENHSFKKKCPCRKSFHMPQRRKND